MPKGLISGGNVASKAFHLYFSFTAVLAITHYKVYTKLAKLNASLFYPTFLLIFRLCYMTCPFFKQVSPFSRPYMLHTPPEQVSLLYFSTFLQGLVSYTKSGI